MILHLLEGFESERVEALFEDFGGEIAKDEAAFARGVFALEDGAIFVKRGELPRQFVKVVAEEIRAVFIRRGFQGLAEIEQMLGEGNFFGSGKDDRRLGGC